VSNFIEKAPDVSVKNPIHFPSHDSYPERIQRIVLAAPGSKPVREPQKVLFVNLIEDRSQGVLNDFVLQGSNAQGPLPSIRFGYVGSLRRLRSIRSSMHAAVVG